MKKIGNAPHPSAHKHTHDVLGLFTCLLDDVMTPKIIFMILIKSRDVIVGWQSKQMELIDMLLWEWKCKVLNNINKEEYGSCNYVWGLHGEMHLISLVILVL